MMQTPIGWAPPEGIERPVDLPAWLDDELTSFAMRNRSTPSALLKDAITDAVREWPPERDLPEIKHLTEGETVTRLVMLEPEVSEALEKQIEKLRSAGGFNDFSDLVVAIAQCYMSKYEQRRAALGRPLIA